MSIGPGIKVAGAAITALGAWMMSGRMDRADIWNQKADSFEINHEYNLMQFEHGNFSGTGMDSAATKFRRFMHYGPGGIFLAARKWGEKISGFVGDVLMSPGTAMAVGGLYLAGLKPHNWVKAAGKFIWDTRILQGSWNLVKLGFSKVSAGSIAKSISRLGVPGAIVVGALAFAAFQFMRVVNGDESFDLFSDELSINSREGF